MINKIYLGYFYQIRHMDNSILPISTCVSDPKWYHDSSKDKYYTFLDKNGILNGMRYDILAPGKSCVNLCHGKDNCKFSPESCKFLENYKLQIYNIDWDKFLSSLDYLIDLYSEMINKSATPCFMFYETPDNPCSERHIIKEWIKSHNILVEDFHK